MPTEHSGKDFHHFFPTEAKGQLKCPKCQTGISGPQSFGKCSDLQQRPTSGQQKANIRHPGRNSNCHYVFPKPVAKKNKQNEELQKQNEELQRLNGELKVEVDDLKHQNAQMRNELDTLNELQVEVDDLKYQNAYMRNELGTLNELIDTAGVKSNILFGGVDPN